MRVGVSTTSLSAACAAEERRLARGVTGGMRDATTLLKEGLRDDMRAARLGDRLANTWRARTYPQGKTSLHPTGYAWSNAPEIALQFDTGSAIVPINGHQYLAIPTASVPRGRRNRRLTVAETEAKLGKLIVIKGRNGNLLGLYDASRTRSGRRRGGAKRTLVLLFTFVRQVAGRKRTDVRGVVDRVGRRVPSLIEARL